MHVEQPIRYREDAIDMSNERNALMALADLERIRLLAALDDGETTTQGLATATDLPADVVGKHLAVLGKAGLIESVRDGRDSQLSVARHRFDEIQAELEQSDLRDESSVLPEGVRQFFRDGRLVSMPAKRSKQIEVLNVLIEDFEIGQAYPELEVNQVIARRYEDFATVRRDFVDEGLMTRERGIYLRTVS
jgi:hypothetical protein